MSGAQARYLDRAVLNVLHYDNRADSTAYSASIDDFAWETTFDAAALRVETAGEWTAIVQWLAGDTYVAPGRFSVEWEFASRSALLAKRSGSTCSPCATTISKWNPGAATARQRGRPCLDGGVFVRYAEALALHAGVAAGSQRRGSAACAAERAGAGDRNESRAFGALRHQQSVSSLRLQPPGSLTRRFADTTSRIAAC